MEVVTLKQIAEAIGRTKRSAERRALKDAWPFEERVVSGGRQRMYPITALPTDVQAALVLKNRRAIAKATVAATPEIAEASANFQALLEERLKSAESRFLKATDRDRNEALERKSALVAVQRMVDAGEPLMRAREIVAAQMRRENIKGASWRSLARWADRVKGAPEHTWLMLLLPERVPARPYAECDPQVWDWYKGHYLSRTQPTHRSTYLRCVEMCQAQGWKIPSNKTLIRRMRAEVSRYVQVLEREGEQAAMRLFPSQKRSAHHFAPGEAVNGDGLKFDRLWVRFEDGEVINTATGWFWQCVRFRKILAWRLDKTENTDLFRLATYDLLGVCAPKYAYLDNTRVAANKVMTAGARTRYRFGARPEDGIGLLQMLQIEPHFTNPDKVTGNPGAKPIERAFGIGGLHEQVATHPRLAGRGFSQATAIPVAELREVIAEEVARHNARKNRRTPECTGALSFDEAWAKAIELNDQPVRVLTAEQRGLLLLSREIVHVDSNTGHVTLRAGRGPNGSNRYWSEALAQYAGRKVAAHFDPANLASDLFVYGLDGTYLCRAQHQPTVAFNSTADAREYAKLKERRRKALRQAAAAENRMSNVEQRASLYASSRGDTPPAAPAADPKVVAGHFRRTPKPERDAVRRTGTDDGQAAREMRMDEFMKRAMAAREKDRL